MPTSWHNLVQYPKFCFIKNLSVSVKKYRDGFGGAILVKKLGPSTAEYNNEAEY